MRARALIAPAFAAAMLLGGSAYALDAGAKTSPGPTGPNPANSAPTSLGPVGSGASIGAPDAGGFGAAPGAGGPSAGGPSAGAGGRSQIDSQLQAARERMNAKVDGRLGLDAAAAQRAQSR